MGNKVITAIFFAAICVAIWNGIDLFWSTFLDHRTFTFNFFNGLILPAAVGAVIYFVTSRNN